MNDALKSTIESSISECLSHIDRMSQALVSIELPLTLELLENMNSVEIAFLDQFLFRFTKLQDSIANRMIPSIFALLEDPDKSIPYLDKLNRLEKLTLIPSVQEWQYLRELRNNLTHDYPENREKNVETLNIIIKDWTILRDIFINLKNAYLKYQ